MDYDHPKKNLEEALKWVGKDDKVAINFVIHAIQDIIYRLEHPHES